MEVNQKFVYIFLITFVYNIYHVKSILPPSYKVTSGEAPFMVYIRSRHHYCGGIILNEHIVLTARHCIYEDNMMVTAGGSSKFFDKNAQTVGVKRTLPHENYLLDPNGVQAYYDVGLLLLNTPLTFNSYIKPIEWTYNIDFHKPVVVYGWGSTDAFENSPSYYLRAKNIYLIPENVCIDMLKKAITKCNKQVYELCAQKSTCRGDSGSPLTQKVGNVTKLVGVTSWVADDNINCDRGPAVFENVGYFSDWIKNGINVLLRRNATENFTYYNNVVR